MNLFMPRLLVLSILGLAVVHCMGCAREVSPIDATNSAFTELEVRCALALEMDIVPKSMTELPKRRGWVNRTLDGWGTEVEVQISEPSGPSRQVTMSMRSAGPDRVFGTPDDLETVRTVDNETGYFSSYAIAEDGWLELRKQEKH